MTGNGAPVGRDGHERAGTDAFTLLVPEGWRDRTVVTLVGGEAGSYAANIVVTTEALCDHMGLGAFSSGWVARLSEEVPVSELRPLEHLSIDDRPAHIRVVGWGAAGLRLTQIAALLVDDETAYAIVGTATDWTFTELEPRFREVVAGFRLTARARDVPG